MAKVIQVEHISKSVRHEIFNETNKENYFEWDPPVLLQYGQCLCTHILVNAFLFKSKIVSRLHCSLSVSALVSLFAYGQTSKPPQMHPAPPDHAKYAYRVQNMPYSYTCRSVRAIVCVFVSMCLCMNLTMHWNECTFVTFSMHTHWCVYM